MRQENIERIIQQRQPLAVQVVKVRQKLSAVIDSVEKFQMLCRSAFQDKELAKDFTEVVHMLDDADRIKSEAKKREDELKHIEKRLTRDKLNIAVIGMARQGKSRLLQTITGLSATEIPDGDGEFCTGVRSDIVNDDTDVTHARVYFMDEQKFLNEQVIPCFVDIQKYDTEMFTIVPNSVSEFANMTLPSPDSHPENDTKVNQRLKRLNVLQSNLPKYRDLLGSGTKHIKKEDIRAYVAQDDENGNRIFFNHFAVDRVEIYCRFKNEDMSNLRLIDLPGLGDAQGVGDTTRVVNALKDQVDLIFFLTRPSSGGTGWDVESTNLYTDARSAMGEKLPIERWSFWVFNLDDKNEKQCKIRQNTIADAQIRVADTVIVNCTKEDDVFENLIDVALAYLSDKIEQNDRLYAENLQKMLASTVHDMKMFAKDMRGLLKDDSDADKDNYTFNKAFKDLWPALRKKLQKHVKEGSQLRLNRDENYQPLEKAIQDVLREEGEKLPLEVSDIEELVDDEGGMWTPYQNALHYLRTRLSSRLQKELDDILAARLNEMKNEICDILITAGQLNGERFKVSDENHKYELLGKMIDYIETSGNSENMPTLLTGLKLLNDWTMSYRSFIQHRIRGALNGLDPEEKECKDAGTPNDAAQAVELLGMLYSETTDKVKQALSEIYSEPNKAAFAVAEQFKDIMIRSVEIRSNSDDDDDDLELQWRQFYWPIRGDVWPEKYGSSQRIRDVNVKLRAPLDALISLLKDSDFVFLK